MTMTRLVSLIAVAAFGLALAQPLLAEAKQPDKGKGHQGQSGRPSGRQSAPDVLLQATITGAEVTIIYDFIRRYGVEPFGPPEGLPPGIAKRYLPQDLLAQLPPRPGYEWLAVGRDILLVVAATAIIVDVLNDVL
ncbi:MAG: hypothetical protein AB7P52_16620 [Alphaproteobacteria bacterium]